MGAGRSSVLPHDLKSSAGVNRRRQGLVRRDITLRRPRVGRRWGFHPGRGTESRSSLVYGCSGDSKIRSVEPRSTTRPRHITMVSSDT